MLKRLLTLSLVVMVLLGLASNTYAQGRLTTTTLSASIANARVTQISITSATGWTASTFPGNIYYAYVDHEAMLVRTVSGTTITVDRGQLGTYAAPHASGAYIMFGHAGSSTQNQSGATVVTGGPFITTAPTGSCTRTANATLPVIVVGDANVGGGSWFNCNNGSWVKQTNPADVQNTPLVAACSIPIGSVAYASVGTNTTDIANKRMTTSFYVPYTFYATGLQVLQGGTATTDNITAQLADAGGKVFAPGAAAGVLLSGASTFKNVPFANAQWVTGPALYMASIVGNGTAAGAYQTVPASTFKNLVSQGTTSITFGTFPDFTPPTTFTADLAPVVCLY